MAFFMTQFSYTTEAWAALAKNPVDRGPGIDAIFKSIGGRLIGLYYSLGEYDGVAITEAPDAASVAAALVAVIGAGHVKTIKTTSLLSPSEMVEALKKSGGLNYSAPK